MDNPFFGVDVGKFGALNYADSKSHPGFIKFTFETEVQLFIPVDLYKKMTFKFPIPLDSGE